MLTFRVCGCAGTLPAVLVLVLGGDRGRRRRACLFCEFRMDRFTWGDDVALSEPDADGVRHFVGNPDFESSPPTQQYRRAVIARIRGLLS